MTNQKIPDAISVDEAFEEVRQAVAHVPMPFGIYSSDDRLLVCSNTVLDLIRDKFPDGHPNLLETPVTVEDVARAFYSAQFEPEIAAKQVELELERHATRESTTRDIENQGKWIRRTRAVAPTGQTVSYTVPIDELVKKASALHEAKEQLEHLAFHDPLTGLPNRRGLSEHLQRLARIPEKEAFNVAVLHVDLDKFKMVNDTLGHDAGDTVLSVAAEILVKEVRDSDVVARVGGDEFVVVCHDVHDENGIAKIARRIVTHMAHPIEYKDEKCQIGASIGIAITSAHNISEHVLMDADIALYEAKNKGRGRFEFFYPIFRDRYSTMQRRMNEVRDAMALNAFEPFFQPQICTSTGKVVGLEALARLRDREHGIRLPTDFLPAVEEARLTDALDEMILRKTLKAIRSWKDEGLDVPRVSLNISESRLQTKNLADSLKWALDDFDLPLSSIGFEILETVVVSSASTEIIDNINSLSDAGFKISLDDFGTGNASIASLRNLSLDSIKIDQSFISGVENDPELKIITRAMISLAKNLKLEALCEGVESHEQLTVLQDLGADVFQGFLFAKPMEADFLPIWLESHQLERPDLRKSA